MAIRTPIVKPDSISYLLWGLKNMTLSQITSFKGFSYCDHGLNTKLNEETSIFFLENLIISIEYFTSVQAFTFVALKESAQMEQRMRMKKTITVIQPANGIWCNFLWDSN